MRRASGTLRRRERKMLPTALRRGAGMSAFILRLASAKARTDLCQPSAPPGLPALSAVAMAKQSSASISSGSLGASTPYFSEAARAPKAPPEPPVGPTCFFPKPSRASARLSAPRTDTRNRSPYFCAIETLDHARPASNMAAFSSHLLLVASAVGSALT